MARIAKLTPEEAAEQQRLAEQAALLQQRRAAMRLLKARQSRDDLVEFTKFMMPHPEDADDAEKSLYEAHLFHRALANALERVERGEILRLIVTAPPRHGKLVADSTPVLTTQGWKRHGDLRFGDRVFGPDGKPARVVAVSSPDLASLRVTMTDGSSVMVHPNHEWTVWQRGGGRTEWYTLETRELMRKKLLSGKTKPRATYQLPLRPCVEFDEQRLPMQPYALGAWLGDGTTTKPWITHHVDDTAVADAVAACGYEKRKVYIHATTGVHSSAFSSDTPGIASPFWNDLKAIGVAHNKHIPEAYKHSSIRQRLELLAGLIDTDGHVERKSGRVRIATVSERLADDIADVAFSLGWHACKYEQAPTLSTSGIQGTKPVFYVGFNPDRDIPTMLPRKKVNRFAARRRVGIAKIEPCLPERGRCIQVDRGDGLYCVGREMIVTHNSQLTTRSFPAWFMGRNPSQEVIVGAYNQSFAESFGKDVRTIMTSNMFSQVFPLCELEKGSKASDSMRTTLGGKLHFVGVKGSATGKGAHAFIIDDPIKDRKDANSEIMRQDVWDWFNDVVNTRLMSDFAPIIITLTRWHEDDIVGRITDPTNPNYNADFADQWHIINIPAIAEENDVLGRQVGEALWPERAGIERLKTMRALNPAGFSALYQQRPTPEDGDFFEAHMIQPYKAGMAPEKLRIYAASDHAVGIKQENDKTCLLVVGVDDRNMIWVLDCWWRRAKTDAVVDAMIALMKKWKPLTWWAESGHISKSIGPFLFKRMAEEKVFVNVSEQVPSKDKVTRAQSIQGRMAMGMVRFPSFEPWYEDAKQELLKFPQARHDDFVDSLAHIGLGLERQIKAPTASATVHTGPKVGTLAWVKHDARFRNRQQKINSMLKGM